MADRIATLARIAAKGLAELARVENGEIYVPTVVAQLELIAFGCASYRDTVILADDYKAAGYAGAIITGRTLSAMAYAS